ncbi:MAG TPA: 1-deoxy-D-xylulose-5-phosphate synthase, partial [Bacteroidales bacterium]|nr:1-deoxy-D-xylulose-5-phosphate synthase [Bacteroidales bacterium]
MMIEYPHLDKINGPEDLKKYSLEELKVVAQEIREYIIEVMCNTPGHVGANLGVVELAIALHYVFNSPSDKIIWDVGHQSYPHKILTGRREAFRTIRKFKGISGFPSRDESIYDAFGTGHASTSISAALGMAIADKTLNPNSKNNFIAVIGDGSMTGGMAYEAMNHAGDTNANILIIYNDNNISIDKATGALKNYFTHLIASKSYNQLKNTAYEQFKETFLRNIINKTISIIKNSLFKHSNFFESFNLRYFGPVNGHNLEQLIDILNNLKNIPGPKILHVLTQKGKGYPPAEKNTVVFHSPGKFDPETGEIFNNANKGNCPIRYQDVYGKTLLELADNDKRIVAVTPAMLSSSSLDIMYAKYPNRVFDVGIAEEHAVTFSAGLAAQGLIPFTTIYSTFLQRAYDQIIHDVALQNLPVIFGIDRGGLVGEDGKTHQGIFDLAYLNLIPNMIISAPIDCIELRNMMFTAYNYQKGPFAIRYPKANAEYLDCNLPMELLPIGKANILKEGEKVLVLSIGKPGHDVVELYPDFEKLGVNPTHVNLRFLKPLDTETLAELCSKHDIIITIEDGTLYGLSTTISHFLIQNKIYSKQISLGVPDQFVEHGSVDELKHMLKYDKENILKT